jgi:hypothetical protein
MALFYVAVVSVEFGKSFGQKNTIIVGFFTAKPEVDIANITFPTDGLQLCLSIMHTVHAASMLEGNVL